MLMRVLLTGIADAVGVGSEREQVGQAALDVFLEVLARHGAEVRQLVSDADRQPVLRLELTHHMDHLVQNLTVEGEEDKSDGGCESRRYGAG